MNKIKSKKWVLPVVTIVIVVAIISLCYGILSHGNASYGAQDQREYAHGMNFVTNPVTGRSYIFWSDQYSKGSDSDGNWQHDIYYQEINRNDPVITAKKTLISADEAQEPASVSVSHNGNFFVTFEDGNRNLPSSGGLAQRYAIYDSSLNAVRAYPQTIRLGGHSGHGACTSTKNVVFWNNDWVDGGAVDGLGTGKDVYVTSMDLNGGNKRTRTVVKGKTRNWWPLLAASSNRSLLVWQRYIKGKKYTHICYALYDPSSNKLCNLPGKYKHTRVLTSIKAKYYTYNVTYISSIKRYVINITTSRNKGIMLLLNNKGKIIASKSNLPAFVRESSPAVKLSGKSALLCYPKAKTGAFFVKVTKKGIHYKGKRGGSYKWSYRGTSGFYTKDGKTACFATLTASSVKLLKFKNK